MKVWRGVCNHSQTIEIDDESKQESLALPNELDLDNILLAPLRQVWRMPDLDMITLIGYAVRLSRTNWLVYYLFSP